MGLARTRSQGSPEAVEGLWDVKTVCMCMCVCVVISRLWPVLFSPPERGLKPGAQVLSCTLYLFEPSFPQVAKLPGLGSSHLSLPRVGAQLCATGCCPQGRAGEQDGEGQASQVGTAAR